MPVAYRPVRILNRDKIDMFRCMPVIEKADGKIISGKPALRHGRDIMVTAKQNAIVVKQAFRDLAEAFEQGQQLRLIVPVNSYALASMDSSTLMIAAFKELATDLRQQVIIEVFDFPNPLTLDILDDITIRLMPFFDKLMAEPTPGTDNFEVFVNCNYFGVSFDLEARELNGDEAIKSMTKFWGEATKRRLKAMVQGVSEAGLSEKADRYEIFSQDGPFIAQDNTQLAAVTP